MIGNYPDAVWPGALGHTPLRKHRLPFSHIFGIDSPLFAAPAKSSRLSRLTGKGRDGRFHQTLDRRKSGIRAHCCGGETKIRTRRR
jgi:hypothetical protein